VNYLHTRACGARTGYCVAWIAGIARNPRNTIREKARAVGLTKQTSDYSAIIHNTIREKARAVGLALEKIVAPIRKMVHLYVPPSYILCLE
jgi:hypothetical protein